MNPGTTIRFVRALFCASMMMIAAVVCGTAQPNVTATHAADYTFSGPYTHKNLTIYLVHGKSTSNGKNILTLQEAMEKHIVKVYETGSVNELSIENVSKQSEVFVQSGDIVRGGRQDRVLSYDLLLPPKSGRVPIASFCVESGRWTQRGGESGAQFNSSTKQISGRELKLAAKFTDQSEQGEVWRMVDSTQNKLSASLGEHVNSATSETSMELTLDNDKIKATTDEYVTALKDVITGQDDVIGYVFAVNGKISSADVYADNALFRKLWGKLLNASAVEAIADKTTNTTSPPPPPPTEADVRSTLADPDGGVETNVDVNARVRVVTHKTKDNVLFETRDRKANDGWVHRSYMRLR